MELRHAMRCRTAQRELHLLRVLRDAHDEVIQSMQWDMHTDGGTCGFPSLLFLTSAAVVLQRVDRTCLRTCVTLSCGFTAASDSLHVRMHLIFGASMLALCCNRRNMKDESVVETLKHGNRYCSHTGPHKTKHRMVMVPTRL